MSILKQMYEAADKISENGKKFQWWARCDKEFLEEIAREKGCLKRDKQGLYIDTGRFKIRIANQP